MLLLADMTEMQTLRKQLVSGEHWLNFSRKGYFSDLYGYLIDVSLLAEKIKDDKQLEKYFPSIPKKHHGVDIALRDGKIFLGEGLKHSLDQIAPPQRGYYYTANSSSTAQEPKVEFMELIPETWKDELIKSIEKFVGLSIGVKITEDGLNTKMAVNNPLAAVQ